MLTTATGIFFHAHTVYKSWFIKQCTPHLYGFETIVKYLINLLTGNQTTYIYQRHMQCFSEFYRG